MNYKPPLTIDQQLNYLETNKRVVYKKISKENAKTILTKYGYINVITPFKYKFALKDNKGNVIKDSLGNHQYTRDIDFLDYYNEYQKERNDYPLLYEGISNFEKKLNSIISHKIINYYNIDSDVAFNKYKSKAIQNINNSGYREKVKIHMIKEFNDIENSLNNNNSIYITFDRLSLNQTITLFRSADINLKKNIFNTLYKNHSTLGFETLKTFEDHLTYIVQIRNFVFHNNSLTILLRYSDFANKTIRSRSNRKVYSKLINKLKNNK